jgi:transcriptional regulator with XRE-family HTH domain
MASVQPRYSVTPRRLERGLENPTVAVLERIAKALSANIEEFSKCPVLSLLRYL